MVVTKGRCGLILASGEKLPVSERSLWVIRPGFVHGWHGNGGACGMLSFQVERVPLELSAFMRASDFLEYRLSPSEFDEIAGLETLLHPDFTNRDPVNELRFDRAIIQMSLTLIAGLTVNGGRIADMRVAQTVHKAVEWLECHLTDQPSVRDMAAAVGVSSSYLRRFFKSRLNRQPHQVMMDIKMEVAARLLATTTLNQDAIAATAGFASVRAFTRAFCAHKQCSPGTWRLRARADISASRSGEKPAPLSSAEADDEMCSVANAPANGCVAA